MQARPYYLAEADIGARTIRGGLSILGILGFGAKRPSGYDAGPWATVAMRRLDDAPPYEVWASPHPAVWNEEDGAAFAIAGDALFITLRGPDPDEPDMHATAFDIYRRIFALAGRTGHPHLIRIANYIPHITAGENGTERYRRFNAGRHQAFLAAGRTIPAAPAACALGTSGGPVIVSALAATQPGRPIENPRQISAYHYPAMHGPVSPSFSRAMLTNASGAAHLYISGTASIVGHQSLHPGDVAAQTAETIRNLMALLDQCSPMCSAGNLLLRIYVRHQTDLPAIQNVLATLHYPSQTMFVQAEICRKELLVEIEAFAQLRV